MSSAGILIGIVVTAALLYLAGRYLSRQRLLRGRHAVALQDIVKELPSSVDRSEAENVLRAIGRSFGLEPETLRLDDPFSKLTALDSWTLGKGQEDLEQWLRANGVISLQSKPQTIRDLIISVLPFKQNGTAGR